MNLNNQSSTVCNNGFVTVDRGTGSKLSKNEISKAISLYETVSSLLIWDRFGFVRLKF